MVTAAPRVPTAKRRLTTTHAFWAVFGLMALFVALTRERTLLDPQSFLRQRYAPIPWLMLLHGIPGAAALILGAFQFSSRLRQKYLPVHRVMGRVYVFGALISAPAAVVVAHKLPIPTLNMASAIQSTGWILTTLTALYCVRTGRIQQHREWMMRSYPFAMVFVVARVLNSLPAIQRMGPLGIATVVWSTIATACFLPSFIIAWQQIAKSRPVPRRETAPKMMAAD